MLHKLHSFRRRLRQSWRRWRYQISDQAFSTAIVELMGDPVETLFVHSSLSGCGEITGGPKTVIDALSTQCSTLCLPTHTYCYPSDGEVPIYDPRTTRSAVGAITDYFWRLEGVTRSLHPTHSLAGRGPLANEICAGHERCDTPCGPGTPYEALVNLDASVLMLGVTFNTYTLFHYTEAVAECEYLYEATPYELKALGENHEIINIRMFRQDMAYRRRFEEMGDELVAQGLVRSRGLGAGQLHYAPSSSRIHEFVLDQLRCNSSHLLKRP